MKKRVAVATTKFVSHDRLIRLAESIRSGDVPELVAIGGGVAMQVWGSTRLTGDLDLIAADDMGVRGEPLSFGGVRSVVDGIPLDVIVRDDKWALLYEEALRTAVEVEGVGVPVIAPEYLLAMKMVAGRPKDEIDARFLVLLPDFDHALAESVVDEHLGPYAVNELESIVAEAKWLRSRGKE